MKPITDQIIDLIESSGESRYRISLGSGVHQSVLCRLVNEQTALTIANAERLADYFGLRIILAPKGHARRRDSR